MPADRRNRIVGLAVLFAGVVAVAAAVVVSRAVRQDELARTDGRLRSELTRSVGVLDELAPAARRRAVRLAGAAAVQRALADRDESALRRIAAGAPGVAFEIDGDSVGARVGALAVSAAVVSGQGEIGRVLVDVPVAAVQARSAFAQGDRLVAGRVGPLDPSPSTRSIDGEKYRTVSTAGGTARLTALASYEPLAEAVDERRRRVALAALVSFAAFVVLAFLAVRRTRREGLHRWSDVPPGPDPRRSREAAELVGNALAAGHDLQALLPVILDSAVTITGAVGARLVADGNELVRAGAVDGGGPPLTIPLAAGPASEGLLVLHPPPGKSFDDASMQLAEWLAGRASIALQNAHLHRVTQQLASTDELTQLANRRQFDEALAAEVLRAERFRDPVAVVVADLDNFKEINDRYGHEVGDLVLRAFANVIRANVREVDLAARYGGEEFTVLLPATDAEGGRQLAERLRVAAGDVCVDSGGSGMVTVRSSFGVASFPAEPTAAALMRAADRALYRAKAAGKDTVVLAAREEAKAQ